MKKLLFLFFISCVSWGWAQDTINVTQQVALLLQGKSSEIFPLHNPKIFSNGLNTTVESKLLNGKGELIFKSFNGRISGFIYAPNGESFLFQQIGNDIFLIKIQSDKLIKESKVSSSLNGSYRDAEAAYVRPLPLGNSLTADAWHLESKPGSAYTIYLDFDGEDITGMGFNYSTMVNTNAAADQIRLIWEVISADFIAFDINVTTNRTLFDATPVTNRGWCIFGNNSLGQAAGLGFPGSFGTTKACIVSTKAAGYGVDCGHIGAHELGHTFGLYHDGRGWPGPNEEYYGGTADWSPIMGYSYGKPFATWSKGEYQYATHTEDDIAIIASHCAYRADDYTKSEEIIYGAADTINWQDNHGIIENRDDVDTFFIQTTASGRVHLKVSPMIDHTDLDVEFVLLDAAKNILSVKNKARAHFAEIDTILPAGKYFLVVRSGEEPTYFTKYSSFGYYEITGSVEKHLLLDFDAVIYSINGLENACGMKTTASVELKNAGTNYITGGVLSIYLDNVLDTTLTISSIAPNTSFVLSNLDFTDMGLHEVKAVYNAPQGINEKVVKNNVLTKSYKMAYGIAMQFSTNVTEYNSNKPFTWTIKDNGGNAIVNSASIEVVNKNNVLQQNFCLAPACYSFEFSGNFNMCSAQYTAFQQGSTYNANDIVTSAGKVYKAKWWTQKMPPSSEWEYIGTCNSGSFYAKLNDIDNTEELANLLSSATYNSTPKTENICIQNTVSTEEFSTVQVSLFPNPSNGEVTINCSDNIQQILIFDMQGKRVLQSFENNIAAHLDIQHLSQGIYTVQIVSPRSTLSTKLIKF